jgi:repressor LexA
MQGLCYSLDKRTGNLPPVENVKEIYLINSKLKGKLCQAYSPFPTLLLYNFSYGKVITHRYKYIHSFVSCQEVKTQKCVKVMSDIGKRIRELREVLGLTQKQFGEKIGKSWRTVQDWEAGKSSIPDHTLRFISSTFGVSYEWLKTGQGEMWERKEKTLLEELEAKTKELFEKLVRIPVVGRAGAGFPESPADMDVIGWVLVSKETFQKGGKFSVQVRGDSMEPTLHDGDFVVFKTYVGDGSDIPNGKVVVVRNHHGELVVKRLIRTNGLIMLTSDNPKYPPIPPEQIKTEDLRIVGVAVKIVREIEV